MSTKTEEIILRNGNVIRNPYQGTDKRVLFVCTAGILRSATAARIYAQKYNTRCAGSHIQYALIPVTEDLLLWADEVVFMTNENYFETNQILDMQTYIGKVRVLDIWDDYNHMDAGLIAQLHQQYEPL